MENIEDSNKNQGYPKVSSEVNSCPSPAITEQTNEHKREAICKICGVIWHPYDTTTRRPTRCPYCRSRKTEWVDVHPELLALRDTGDNTEVKTGENEWNAPESAWDEPSENTGLLQVENIEYGDETEEEDNGGSRRYPMASSRSNPDYAEDNAGEYACEKKDIGIPKAAVYLILGAMLIYGLIHIWNVWKKPFDSKNSTTVSRSPDVLIERPYAGLSDMSRQNNSFRCGKSEDLTSV